MKGRKILRWCWLLLVLIAPFSFSNNLTSSQSETAGDLVEAFFHSGIYTGKPGRDVIIAQSQLIPASMLDTIDDNFDASVEWAVFYMAMALRNHQPVWMPFCYPSLVQAYYLYKSDDVPDMEMSDLDAVFNSIIDNNNSFRNLIGLLPNYEDIPERDRLYITTRMFSDLDPKVVTATRMSAFYFKAKFKAYLYLVKKYPESFQYDGFSQFLENIPDKMAAKWEEDHTELERSMGRIKVYMGMVAAPEGQSASPESSPVVARKRVNRNDIARLKKVLEIAGEWNRFVTDKKPDLDIVLGGIDATKETGSAAKDGGFRTMFKVYKAMMDFNPAVYRPENFPLFVERIDRFPVSQIHCGNDKLGKHIDSFQQKMFDEKHVDIPEGAVAPEASITIRPRHSKEKSVLADWAKKIPSADKLRDLLDKMGNKSIAVQALRETLLAPDATRRPPQPPGALSIISIQGKALMNPGKNNLKFGLEDYQTGRNPAALMRLHDFEQVQAIAYRSKADVVNQARALKDRYYIQPVRGGGNCLYLAYLSGWLHALVEDVVTGRNPQAIEHEIQQLLHGRAQFRDYLFRQGRAVGLVDTTDAFVTFLQELQKDPTIAGLYTLIMPTHPVQVLTHEGHQVTLWGGKEHLIDPLIQYLRNYTVYLTREDLYQEAYRPVDPDARFRAWEQMMGTAGFFPELYGCQQGVRDFARNHAQLQLNPLDTFMFYQSQSGVNATAMEMKMLYTLRPFSVCIQADHQEYEQRVHGLAHGFNPGVYPEGERIVILQQNVHFVALIPKDLCYVARQTRPRQQQFVEQSNVNMGGRIAVRQDPLPVTSAAATPFVKAKPKPVAQALVVAAPPPVPVKAAGLGVRERPNQQRRGVYWGEYKSEDGNKGKALIDTVLPAHRQILQHYVRAEVNRTNMQINNTCFRGQAPCHLPLDWRPHVRLYHKLGEGGQGEIFSASYMNENHPYRVVKVSAIDSPEGFEDMTNCRLVDQFFRHPANWHDCIALDRAQHYDDRTREFFQLMDRYPTDLHNLIPTEPGRQMDKELAMVLIHQMLQAIAHMHLHGWIHRDIKPGNTMLSPDGGCVKIIDFGMSKEVGGGKAMTSIKGTPRYMVFNPGDGEYNGFAADMAALAVTYFHLRAGFMADLIEIPPNLLYNAQIPYYRKVHLAYQRICEYNPFIGEEADFDPEQAMKVQVAEKMAQYFGGYNAYDKDEARFIVKLLNPRGRNKATPDTLYRLLRDEPLMIRARTLELMH
ncbi:protein kinase domain-containing protein [Endozoicomonadaceae bacterium StTr2]